MEIENEFVVAAAVADLWSLLLDVERTARCMPGGELTETVDDRTWRGKVNIRLGMVSLAFAGTVKMTERDDAAHWVKLRAEGVEQKGKGAASATVTSWLDPRGAETAVKIQADLQLTGAVAQVSRGLLPEISRRLTDQFADCLQASFIDAQAAGGMRSEVVPPGPISGLRLGLSAMFAVLRRAIERLIGRRAN